MATHDSQKKANPFLFAQLLPHHPKDLTQELPQEDQKKKRENLLHKFNKEAIKKTVCSYWEQLLPHLQKLRQALPQEEETTGFLHNCNRETISKAIRSLWAQILPHPKESISGLPPEEKREVVLHKLKRCNILLTTAVVALVGTVSILNLIGGTYSFCKVYTIQVDQVPTVAFSLKSQAQEALDYYLTNKGYDDGGDVYLAGRVEIGQTGAGGQVVYNDPKKAFYALDKALSPMVMAAAVTVDGKEKAWLADEDAADQVLQKVKDSYLPHGDVVNVMVADFRQKVTVQPSLVPETQVMQESQAMGSLLSPEVSLKTYQAKQGDSPEKIAKLYGIDVSTLYLYNPSLQDAGSFDQGQELEIATAKPVLNLISRVKVTNYEEIPYDTVYTSNRLAPAGTQEVAQAGQSGTEKVVNEVFLENGKEVTRTQLATTVLSKPVDQVVSLGGAFSTASRGGIPVDYSYSGGSGIVQWPVRGVLTSYYGGARHHTGLDIANDCGTPIVAAASGIVTFSGWLGSYGNIVKLNNGDGMETWYAHLSSTAAEVGSYVEAGTLIGYLGSTGNSTGPHLHFEVRFNGCDYDPLNYLP